MKVIRNLLTEDELSKLRALAKITSHFSLDDKKPDGGIYKCGTVSGFGYKERAVPDSIYQKFLSAAGLKQPFECRSIQQFIAYEKGGFIGTHKDWVYDTTFSHQLRGDMRLGAHACSLHRVNAMVTSAAKGGELFVDGEEVKLNEGDALVFRPELQAHGVKEILEGSRMIFTIGFHYKDPVRVLPRILA